MGLPIRVKDDACPSGRLRLKASYKGRGAERRERRNRLRNCGSNESQKYF
jgi:hypothetical protein